MKNTVDHAGFYVTCANCGSGDFSIVEVDDNFVMKCNDCPNEEVLDS